MRAPASHPRSERMATPRGRQRGGMSVTMMLVMVGLVAMLGLVEIGYVFWAKRDAQKVADLAALAGAQRLDLCRPDRGDNSAARGNALADNRFPGTLAIECGHWNPANPATDHFSRTAPSPAPLNAVKVVAQRSVLPFFGQNETLPTVGAQAVATRAPPLAVFTVGSQLLRTNGNSPLGNVLRLVGVNLDQTTLLGYDGLAQAKVTPAGLLQALGIPVDANIGIGEFNALLAARRVSLGQLIDATASVLSQRGVANVDLRALRNALAAQLDINAANVQLGSSATSGGLFAQVVAPEGPASSALRAEINVLDLLGTGISIANNGRAVDVQGLSILGLVNAKAAIIEPPSIAIGGIGTRAYNAQVRVHVDIDTATIPAVGGVLNLLGTRLHLPLYADVTNAMGTLTAMQCGATPPTATVRVDASVLRACVGNVAESARFSTRNVCDTHLQNDVLLRLLGANLVTDQLKFNALTHSESITLAPGQTGSTWINRAQLGTAVNDLVRELLRVLGNVLSPRGTPTSEAATRLATQYVEAANQGYARYDVDRTIALLKNGSAANKVPAFGDWQVPNGVRSPCSLLGLVTCYKDGSVWDGYRISVTGEGLGLLDSLTGALLGGLTIKQCNGLVSVLLTYNTCVRDNLASYIQTAPAGLLDAHTGNGSILDPGTNTVNCSGLLCTLLKPVLEQTLKPLLNGIGTLLTSTLASLLGLELGRTDVHMQSVHCTPAQLVY